MANYLTSHYKGKYKLLADIDLSTNDFVRNTDGTFDADMVYISCYNGTKVYYWGLNESRRGVLVAFIPKKLKARNVKREMEKQNIEVVGYDESDTESMLMFLASDSEAVIGLLKPYISGAKTSPFSNRNLPRSNIKLPDDKLQEYKSAINGIGSAGMILIKTANEKFMNEVLAKKLRPPKTRKPFDYKTDMKKLMLARDSKTYIWYKGFWDEYIEFLNNELNK